MTALELVAVRGALPAMHRGAAALLARCWRERCRRGRQGQHLLAAGQCFARSAAAARQVRTRAADSVRCLEDMQGCHAKRVVAEDISAHWRHAEATLACAVVTTQLLLPVPRSLTFYFKSAIGSWLPALCLARSALQNNAPGVLPWRMRAYV